MYNPLGRFLGPRIALLVASSVLSLLCAEAMVRVVRPQPLPSQATARLFSLRGMYRNHETAGYCLTPRFSGELVVGKRVTRFSTNSLGLRGDELGPKAGTRIAVFGDSVTFGWSVEQGQDWVAEVQRWFDRDLGRGAVETVNAGVAGYGTENALGLLQAVGGEIRPDVVLLGFFPNDFVDNVYGRSSYSVRDGFLFDEWTHEFLRESLLARESHLWRLWLRVRGLLKTSGEQNEQARRLGQAFLLARNVTPEQLQSSVVRSAELIGRMAQVATGLGARFAVVWLPMDWQVLEPNADTSLDEALRRRVAIAGIESFDLGPTFRAHPARASLYFGGDDTHFTVAGHRVAGDAIARWLSSWAVRKR